MDDRFEMEQGETISSLHVCKLEDDETEYLAVGTGIKSDYNEEPESGRILLFQLSFGSGRRKLELVSEYSILGCAYALTQLHGKLFACVNATVCFDLSVENF